MKHRISALPRLWLFTDERVADEMLLRAIARMPRGSGVIFRHCSLSKSARRALYEQIAAIAQRRRLVLLVGGDPLRGGGFKADGRHMSLSGKGKGASGRVGGITSASAHNAREIAAANGIGVDLMFLSPIFPTRSHPGSATLGPLRFASLTRLSNAPVIALGGMTALRFRRMKALGAYGWAAIDALVR